MKGGVKGSTARIKKIQNPLQLNLSPLSAEAAQQCLTQQMEVLQLKILCKILSLSWRPGVVAAEVKKAPLSLSLSSAQPLSLPKFENFLNVLELSLSENWIGQSE